MRRRAVFVVEEHEQRPVRQPGSLLQLRQRAAAGLGVDHLAQPVQVLARLVPVLHQNVRSALPPQRSHAALRAAAQRPVVAQKLGGAWANLIERGREMRVSDRAGACGRTAPPTKHAHRCSCRTRTETWRSGTAPRCRPRQSAHEAASTLRALAARRAGGGGGSVRAGPLAPPGPASPRAWCSVRSISRLYALSLGRSSLTSWGLVRKPTTLAAVACSSRSRATTTPRRSFSSPDPGASGPWREAWMSSAKSTMLVCCSSSIFAARSSASGCTPCT